MCSSTETTVMIFKPTKFMIIIDVSILSKIVEFYSSLNYSNYCNIQIIQYTNGQLKTMSVYPNCIQIFQSRCSSEYKLFVFWSSAFIGKIKLNLAPKRTNSISWYRCMMAIILAKFNINSPWSSCAWNFPNKIEWKFN